MTAEEIRRDLDLARAALAEATQALAPKHIGGEWERYNAAHDRCIELERELARARGEPCAVEIPWPALWSVGAPLPYVVASGARTLLTYLVRETNPGWDGSTAEVVASTSAELRLVAIVEFSRCLAFRFGSPNDEVLAGHPLHGRGLVGYRAQRVERSPWIAELQAINSVHPQYDPAAWADFVHYVLPFHDDTFECVARSHAVRERLSTVSDALDFCARDILL
jgi:hypothetical protein